ncbi:MAG: tRNA threonylcarbamoyladenosine dehydratase [Verrucomicrobiota bacterium]
MRESAFGRDARYVERFGGIGRLYGKSGLERLAASRVTVVGIGGVGTWVVEGLVRSGVGSVVLVDLDDVCITNTNRQLPAMEGNIGKSKVGAVAERMRLISPGCEVIEEQVFFTERTAEALLSGAGEWVVDAMDDVSEKARLIAGAHARGLGVVTVGGAGGKRWGTGVKVGDLGRSGGDDLLRAVRRSLRRDFRWELGGGKLTGVTSVYSEEKPVYPWGDGSVACDPEPAASLRLDCASGFGTASFVTGAFGFAAANVVVEAIAIEQKGGIKP